ncbi:hypothetical protein L1987_65147 [Smallanthus sonchifolius]|uniref:Uncharacterized protein n=1 Tax=Smallanthus sonchifolius TaxID=185202 RepID=A0ACB9BTM5_9ASTR|nr:hypothetical protein L1987_65147 [Smallanthus sonchifolius]
MELETEFMELLKAYEEEVETEFMELLKAYEDCANISTATDSAVNMYRSGEQATNFKSLLGFLLSWSCYTHWMDFFALIHQQ